jgi:hypothetical protein
MKNSQIIKGIDSYIDYFKINQDKPIDSLKTISYSDFLQIHLPKYADLKWNIHSFQSNLDYLSHAEEVKQFLLNNGSIVQDSKSNFLGSFSNAQIISLLVTIGSLIFGIGYYFGTEKINQDYHILKKEYIDLKDSLKTSSQVILKTIPIDSLNERNK